MNFECYEEKCKKKISFAHTMLKTIPKETILILFNWSGGYLPFLKLCYKFFPTFFSLNDPVDLWSRFIALGFRFNLESEMADIHINGHITGACVCRFMVLSNQLYLQKVLI